MEVGENDEPVPGFRLRLEARVKNGYLVGAREKLGLTLKEAGRKIGISDNTLCMYENMRTYPSEKSQNKICDFYRSQGEFMLEEEVFPKELRETKIGGKHVTEGEIPKSKLISLSTVSHKELPCVESEPQNIFDGQELIDVMEGALETLGYRERELIKLRFGFGGEHPYTLVQAARKFKVSIERIRQMEGKALRKLQHPVRSKELRRFSDFGQED